MAELDVQLKQVLKRFPPGDRWTPVDAEQPIFSSLTEGIEWVFQSTQKLLTLHPHPQSYVYTLIKKPQTRCFLYVEPYWYGKDYKVFFYHLYINIRKIIGVTK